MDYFSPLTQHQLEALKRSPGMDSLQFPSCEKVWCNKRTSIHLWVKWIQTQNWTPNINAFLTRSLDIHQSGKHAWMSSTNLVLNYHCQQSKINVEFVWTSYKIYWHPENVWNFLSLQVIVAIVFGTSNIDQLLKWLMNDDLSHRGCWFQLQMNFYNKESMKDLMRPVECKMWASYIIKRNINVLVEFCYSPVW